MTTQNTTSLNALFTSKATDISRFLMESIQQGKIVTLPSAESVNNVFLSLPKANRDKTTYVLIFTMSSLNDKGKLQPILDKAINLIADKESKSYETDKAVTKCISLVKSYIALGPDLIDTLSDYQDRYENLHHANAKLHIRINELETEVATLTVQPETEIATLTEQPDNV